MKDWNYIERLHHISGMRYDARRWAHLDLLSEEISKEEYEARVAAAEARYNADKAALDAEMEEGDDGAQTL